LRRKFHTLDVFTDTPFAGNPLAVVVDTESLDAARMQAIAREFNLSETVFLLEPRDPVNTARLRIFTPMAELPFAGHPTVGAAALIARLRAPELLGREDILVVLEEEIGNIICNVRGQRGKPLYASFDIPRLPERVRELVDLDAIAGALSIERDDIGFDAHAPGVWTAGNPMAFVPVRSRDAIARARTDASRFEQAFGPGANGAFLYTAQVEREGSDVHARMFAPAHGITEDPATGSAAAAFAGVAVAFENPEDGTHAIVIEQGFEMGRPSIIHLGVEVADGTLVAASIGGQVVRVSEGTIEA
jgi:trans-2,3-dihydro-3-hydroxyanthranilate isomerase